MLACEHSTDSELLRSIATRMSVYQNHSTGYKAY
jgi:hypothetical protein